MQRKMSAIPVSASALESHALDERARVSWNSRFIGKGPETAPLRYTERGVTTPSSSWRTNRVCFKLCERSILLLEV
jgi:hypothetical protein